MRTFFFLFIVSVLLFNCKSGDHAAALGSADTASALYEEKHRPQFHFSPKEKWMNDPNGMVYYKGEYHLFYQHYPEAMVWGPMHWGHAVSKDLIHWDHLPIALYPDSLGLIFSGSAVVDERNTSGFGTKENPPLVAVFTYHSLEKEKAGRSDYQYQGIAFSTDNGRTWNKYEKNPVLKNQGIKDFRDPKVFYHDASSQWVMILAVKDHVELWGSPNLKEWNKLSDFGYNIGAHGGVWECPDLFKLSIEGESTEKWVMIVSINPGGPNGGSATQYFIGDFDGKSFIQDKDQLTTRWIDYGPDNYAGVTWANAPDDRKVFLGWMNNWAYAQELPTESFRGAGTLPRDIRLSRVGKDLLIKSSLVPELASLNRKVKSFGKLKIDKATTLDEQDAGNLNQSMLQGTIDAKDFKLRLSNKVNQNIVIGYDAAKKQFYIDKSKSGNVTFSKNYPVEVFAPRFSHDQKVNFTIVTDVACMEVFFDDGLSVMTSWYFPDEPFTTLTVEGKEPLTLDSLTVTQLESIWKKDASDLKATN